MSTLKGRVAVVTGTSSGLGAQFAKALDAAGAHVVLASRRNETDLALTQILHDALAVRCDVRDSEDRASLVAAAIERHGRIDILVNNAGVAFSGPAEEEDIERFKGLLDTNSSPSSLSRNWLRRTCSPKAAARSATSPLPQRRPAWTVIRWPGTRPARAVSSR